MNLQKENIHLEKIAGLLKKAPTDDGTFCTSLYDLYILICVAKGISNISNGEYITLEEFNAEMEGLHESYNRQSSYTKHI